MKPGLISLLIVSALVLLLQFCCQAGFIRPTVVIPPSAMLASLSDIVFTGRYNHAIAVTLGEVAVATTLAVMGGFTLGVAIYASPFLRRGLEPYLASYYAVPTIIFYPVFVVLFGVGSGAIIAIAVMLAIVVMITATLGGLDQMPRVYHKTAQVMRLSPLRSALFIILPATAPYLFTGLRLAVAYAFIGVIASEFILSADGLGYAIAYAYNNFDNRAMYGLMLLVIIIVTLVNTALDLVDRRLQARRLR